MISPVELKTILLEANLLTSRQFEDAKKEAGKRKINIDDYLPETGLISDEQLGQLIANYLKFTFINLRKEKIDLNVLNLIPELVAKNREAIAFAKTEENIKVAMKDPGDIKTRHFIEKRSGQIVLPYFITNLDFQAALGNYRPSLEEEFKKLLERLKNSFLPREKRDELTIEMVDVLMKYGYQNKASDIHIEPYQKKVVVRFRIDGIMHEVLSIPKELHELILTRIKILSKMRTDEHRAAQDGKIRFNMPEETIDVRVSVVPVVEGENVVMRILSAKARQFNLENLGFSETDLTKIKENIKRPHGMILVTGPTGCGKTTTLYAVMKILNKPEINIATIEDPVEYDIEGISQIQVNPKTNLTFAKGLRAIVRQDPDIIMIGEIRDTETAGIAVNSALTGHLVLSTLHTNDAATALPRLLDMEIEPFLIASTVNMVIAQRLIRQICPKCRASYKLTEDEKRIIENDPHIKNIFTARNYKNLSQVRLYKGNGCKVCSNTGYTGRAGIFEILEMTDLIKDSILKRVSSGEIMKIAKAGGMTTMLEDGIRKVFNGTTTLQEVMRVTKE